MQRTFPFVVVWCLLASSLVGKPAQELPDPGSLLVELSQLDPAAQLARIGTAFRSRAQSPEDQIALGEFLLSDRGEERGGEPVTSPLGPEVEAEICELLWPSYFALGRFDDALTCIEHWRVAAAGGDLERRLAEAWLSETTILMQLDRLGQAELAAEQALEIFAELGAPDEMARANTILGLLTFRQGKYGEATEYHSRVLSMGEESNNPSLRAQALSNLGLVYKKVGSMEEARDAFEQAFALAEEAGDERGRIVALSNLGNAYRELGELETALEIHRGLLTEHADGQGPLWRASCHGRVGRVLVEMGRDEEAEPELRQAIELRRGLGLTTELANALLEFGRLQLRRGEEAEALAMLEEAVDKLGTDPGLLERDVYQALAEAYRENQRYEESFEAYERFLELDHRLTTADLTERIAELSTRAKLAAREAEVDRLRAERDHDQLALEQERAQNLVLLITTIALGVLGIAGFAAMRIRARLLKRVREEEALLAEERRRAETFDTLTQLAAGTAHDFNNMLTAILGNLGLARDNVDPERLDRLLADTEAAAQQASGLTQELYDFARGSKVDLQVGDLAGPLRNWMRFSCTGTDVDVRFDVDDRLWPAVYDPGQLARVIHNLALNAIESMQGRGRIDLTASNVELAEDDPSGLPAGPYVRVRLTDTGPGVTPELAEHIFAPYVSSKNKGRGMGLATSYATVQRLDGRLRLVQAATGGATFEILLPARPSVSSSSGCGNDLSDHELAPLPRQEPRQSRGQASQRGASRVRPGLTGEAGLHEVGGSPAPKDRHDPERPSR